MRKAVSRTAPPLPHRDPEGLIARALAGDSRAFRTLYDAHAERLYRVVLRITRDEELAKDCTQEAFIHAFQRLGSFRGDSSFAVWLHRVAVNVTLSGIRKGRKLRDAQVSLESAPPLRCPAPTRDVMLGERIEAALGSLPELYRVVVVMHDIEGFTHAEIGAVLGIRPGSSKARLSRARALLRDVLADCAEEYRAA